MGGVGRQSKNKETEVSKRPTMYKRIDRKKPNKTTITQQI